ncbi:MAG: hypothetical protein LHW56_11570 [Candidatus Cloacimonetes bacterium]|nr:hypothetical protein [Candidatus Cloacimonadota bacterium]MDY0173526.1 hypothetical protein [Candidatus Cloacimonadaceae bacterium]
MGLIPFLGFNYRPLFIEKRKIIALSESLTSTIDKPKTIIYVAAGSESEEWTVLETFEEVVKKYEETE